MKGGGGERRGEEGRAGRFEHGRACSNPRSAHVLHEDAVVEERDAEADAEGAHDDEALRGSIEGGWKDAVEDGVEFWELLCGCGGGRKDWCDEVMVAARRGAAAGFGGAGWAAGARRRGAEQPPPPLPPLPPASTPLPSTRASTQNREGKGVRNR